METARRAAALGAGAVITGHCGPNAFAALAGAGIDVYQTVEGSAESAVRAFEAGALAISAGPGVDAGAGGPREVTSP